MIYYIYYHSTNPEQNNAKILDTIKSFPAWAILGHSFFMVRMDYKGNADTDANLLEIKQKLKEVGASADDFFIGQMGDEAIWQGYGVPLKQWLISNSVKANEAADESFRKEDATKEPQQPQKVSEDSACEQSTNDNK